MYRKGDLKTIDPPCDDNYKPGYGGCDSFLDHRHTILDHRGDDGDYTMSPCVYLPHSCEEWVIGGVEQIKDLIADLLKEWERLEHEPEL